MKRKWMDKVVLRKRGHGEPYDTMRRKKGADATQRAKKK